MSRLKETRLTTAMVLAAVLAGVPIGVASTSVPRPDMQRIAAGIAKQESSLHSISIWGSARFRGVVAGAGNAPVTIERVDFEATFDGLPQGRYMFVARRALRLWLNGAAPYSEQSYSAAYNGRVGTYLETLNGAINKPFRVLSGRISGGPPKRSALLRSLSGWTYSVFGYPARFSEHERLSQIVANPPRNFTITANAKDVSGGVSRVTLTIMDEAGKTVLDLVPSRGYSIVADSLYLRSPPTVSPRGKEHRGRLSTRPIESFRVRGFFGPIDGVWFPKLVTSRNYAPDGTIRSEFNLHVTKVRLNSAKAALGTYTVRFPVGSTVLDESTGQVIRIGGTPQQQLAAIEKAVTAARKDVATQPARNGGAK